MRIQSQTSMAAPIPLLKRLVILCSLVFSMIGPAWSWLSPASTTTNRATSVRRKSKIPTSSAILSSLQNNDDPTPQPAAKSQSISTSTSSTTTNQSYTVSVAFGDEIDDPQKQRRSIEIPVIPGESILTALERAAGQGLTSATSVPSDCRRGNCLTCSAQHAPGSDHQHLQALQSNGLSPHVAHEIAQRGYILTCSSTVTGPGVQLTVGTNHDLWEFIYKERFETEEAQSTARSAMAKAIRMSAERNVDEWCEQTEKAYRESQTDDERQ